MTTHPGMFLLALTLASASVTAGQGLTVFKLHGGELSPGVISRDMTASVSHWCDSSGGPAIDISVWRGECRLRIGLRSDLTPFADADSEMLIEADSTSIIIADNGARHRVLKNISGLEWEIMLERPPDTNVFSFGMECTGLDFYRQDTLTEYEVVHLGAVRPDSAVGAYVAYHASRRENRVVVDAVGTTRYNYGSGQAFVIYRPRAWDQADTVWCDLSVDVDVGTLSIEVDRRWLEQAEYPVTIDPTFGNTSVGVSSMAWNQQYAYCHILTGTNTYTVPPGKTAEISQYSVYGSEAGADDMDINMTAFVMAAGLPGTRAAPPATMTISGGTPGWFHSATETHVLAAGEEYGVAVSCAPRTGGTLYYNVISSSVSNDNTDCNLGSSNWTHVMEISANISMYATYIEYDAQVELSRRRRGFVIGRE